MVELPRTEWTWNSQRWPLLLSLECMSKTGVKPIAITREKLVLVKSIKCCGNRSGISNPSSLRISVFQMYCFPAGRKFCQRSAEKTREISWEDAQKLAKRVAFVNLWVTNRHTKVWSRCLSSSEKIEANKEMLNWHCHKQSYHCLFYHDHVPHQTVERRQKTPPQRPHEHSGGWLGGRGVFGCFLQMSIVFFWVIHFILQTVYIQY